MCKKPLRIVNPSTWIDPNSAQQLFVSVPCGQCSECIVSYRNEWRNRAYYESLNTFMNGGYILFDTLTYRNGCLPHLSDFVDVPRHLDFPCFSKVDWQQFINRLRSKLFNDGYKNVRENLKVFCACEYGDDIRFTRRPHMHVLFFVNCLIPFDVLSNAISYCWSYGRTDGVAYRGRSYVRNNCVFDSFSDSAKFSVNYVSKYCTKQFSYLSLVEKRLDALMLFDFNTYELAKDYVRLRHFQSKGFGHDALIRLVGKDKLLEDGSFRIIQKNGFFRKVSLHKSLQRKLLYDYYRDEFGRVHFKLNADGFAYKKKFYYRSIDFLSNKVSGLTNNYSEVKREVFEMFFVDGRFKKFDVIDDIIDNSYNVDSGLRNYSAVDYSFIRKRIFAANDYGSKKLGFSCNDVLRHVCRLPHEKEYVDLHSLSSMVVSCDCSTVDSYLASQAVKGDEQLGVLKLIHHLQHVHKNSFNYG